MAARKSRPKKKTRDIKYRNRNEAPVIYTNAVEVNSGPFDVRFRFGRVVETERDSIEIEEVANIYMSPEHALSLFELLKKNLATPDGAESPDE